MTAHALITGVLFRAPECKTSKSGKNYFCATIKCRDGDATEFWRVTVFSESAGDELMRLNDGDAVSAQGSMRAEIYAPEGREARVSLSLIADQVLALRVPPRKREKRPEDRRDGDARGTRSTQGAARSFAQRSPNAPHGAHDADTFGDDIPF